ncbi:MAG: hypothetical protein AB8H80_12610 [Planctomycetota bacterium]
MSTLKACFCFALLVLLAAASFSTVASSQGPRFFKADKVERKTEAGDDGQHTWVAWHSPDCHSCKGVGKSTCVTCARFAKDAKDCPECHRKDPKLLVECRVCAGSGKLADPLESAPCAGCMGAGFLVCTVCGGGGQLKVGGAKRWSDCPTCRGDGGFPCGGCKGKRTMSSLQIKPSLRDAPLDKLLKAKKDLDKTIAKFEAFAPVGGKGARKAVKTLGSAYSAAKKLHPAFKALPKSSKDYMNKTFAGKQFQGSDEREADTFKMLKRNAEYYLQWQRRMLQLAIERAETNAKAGK